MSQNSLRHLETGVICVVLQKAHEVPLGKLSIIVIIISVICTQTNHYFINYYDQITVYTNHMSICIKKVAFQQNTEL